MGRRSNGASLSSVATGPTRYGTISLTPRPKLTPWLRAGLMNALDVGLPWTEDINDELEVAKAAEAFWPYAKIARTRQGIGKRKWRTQ